jgi:SET domain-containing protein
MEDASAQLQRTLPDLSELELDNLIDNAPKCRPGKSQIHGYGLIASEPMVAGEIIIDFSDPEIYVEKTFAELEPWRLAGGKYTGLSEERCLISLGFTKYSLLNHSRQPNAMTDFQARRVVAIADILPGDEITVDYRLEPVSPQAKAHIDHFL